MSGNVNLCARLVGITWETRLSARRLFEAARMIKNVLVYISGPIMEGHGQTEKQNVYDGIQIFNQLLLKGIPAYLPHLHINDDVISLMYQSWIEYDLAVIDHCSHMLMMPRWQLSKGSNIEHKYAIERGIPIMYSVEELEEWIKLNAPIA